MAAAVRLSKCRLEPMKRRWPASIREQARCPPYIEQLERAAIQKALEDNRWTKTKAAAQLGITFRALHYKLKKLGME